MWEALFNQVKGVLGKTYVFAGLIPAALILWGWRAFSAHAGDFERAVTELLGKKESAVTASIFSGIELFWLGLFFFATRGFILRVMSAVPGWLLTPLRWRLLNRQMRRRRKAERRLEDFEAELTALRWLSKGCPLPHDGNYIPEWRKIPNVLDSTLAALERCAGARELLVKLSRRADSPRVPSRRRMRKLTCGVSNLYELTFNHPPHVGTYSEISHWRAAAGDAGVKQIVALAAAESYRSWVVALAEFKSFPEDKWLEPTSLGNRLASLDDYAEKRYGITTSTMWRRLVGVIPKEDRQEIADVQLSIEALTNLCVAAAGLCVAFLIASAPSVALATLGGPRTIDWRTVFLVGAALILSAASYGGAVYASGALCENVMRLVDLHRLKLVSAMGLKSPRTVGEERATFVELKSLFVKGTPLQPDRLLEVPKAPKAEAAPGNNNHYEPTAELPTETPAEAATAETT